MTLQMDVWTDRQTGVSQYPPFSSKSTGITNPFKDMQFIDFFSAHLPGLQLNDAQATIINKCIGNSVT